MGMLERTVAVCLTAALTCSACGGAAGPDGIDEPAAPECCSEPVEFSSGHVRTEIPASTTIPGPAVPPERPTAVYVPGELIAAQEPSARPAICVMLGTNDEIYSIDEHDCLPFPPHHIITSTGGDMSFCAGCVVDVALDEHGSTVLFAIPEPECKIYGGEYRLNLHAGGCEPGSP
jgi:hypothetical protein